MRNLIPSQHRQMKGSNIIPTPIRAVNQSNQGEVEQVLSRLFLMDVSRLDESISIKIYTVRRTEIVSK